MENEQKWADLTPLEKREKRYEWWLSADINFSSPEARKNYRERALRFVSAYRVEKGVVGWLFDKTDMAKAKKILGKTCCISGNVPSSLMVTGGPKEVKEYCRKLIEVCAPGGGFVLAGGAWVSQGNPDNLHAMMEAAKEYGRY